MKNNLREKNEGRLVTEEEFAEIELHEDVERIENNGNSGIDPEKTWYTCYLEDGSEFDFYG